MDRDTYKRPFVKDANMNIKKSLVGLILSMLLGSEMAAADWGDVYYCKMTRFVDITPDGKMESYKPETFQFKLDQARNAMVFGNKGFFKDTVFKLKGAAFDQEIWFAGDKYNNTFFNDGVFFNSMVLIAEPLLTVASADCNKF